MDFKNKPSPDYKNVSFFVQSKGLTQLIRSTTRNTKSSRSLIDVAFTNSKFIAYSGTLNYFVSNHQPTYLINKKCWDTRETVWFEGWSHRNYDKDKLLEELRDTNWEEFYSYDKPENAWEFLLKHISSILDRMCPVRSFKLKNYRPE